MDDDALIEAAAAEAAPAYAALDVAPWAGLILHPYDDGLFATLWGMPDAGPVYGIDGDTMDELGGPEPDGAARRELEARVAADGWELTEPYYLALASRLRALTGLPVLVYEADMPYEEQLARQTGAAAPDDPLDGLDVLVSLRVDERRVAVVYRDAEDQVWTSGRYGFDDPVPGLGYWEDLGANPAVVAGKLPMGAVGVALRVGRGPWVEPSEIAHGYWICALDARRLTTDPKLAYRDAEGAEFALEVPFDGPGLPRLWALQAPPGGRLVQHGGGTEVHEHDGWRIEVTDWGPFAPAAGLVAHELGVDEATVVPRAIAGTVLGHRHGFELAAQDGVWAAVATCGAFTVVVEATGEPPERLDLRLLPLQ